AGDGVLGMSGDRIGQGRLTRAVRTHDGVRLTGFHGEVHALEDLDGIAVRGGDLGVQVLDFQGGHRFLNSFGGCGWVVGQAPMAASSASMAASSRSATSGTPIFWMISWKKPRTTRRRAASSGIPRARR